MDIVVIKLITFKNNNNVIFCYRSQLHIMLEALRTLITIPNVFSNILFLYRIVYQLLNYQVMDRIILNYS